MPMRQTKRKSPNKSLFYIATGLGKTSNSENIYPITALLQTNTKGKKEQQQLCGVIPTHASGGQVGSPDFHPYPAVMR